MPHSGLTSPPRSHAWLALFLFLLVTFAAAGIGSWATSSSVNTWYPTLVKPSWNPPAWVFGPVWTTLYLMMAWAAWLVWKRGPSRPVKSALTIYGVQLLLNAGWSLVFFGQRSPGLALLVIVMLFGAIFMTFLAFRRHSLPAALLLVPYLIWVAFASWLNFTIWRLNS